MKKQGGAGMVVVIVLLILVLIAVIALIGLQFTGVSITGGVISEPGEITIQNYAFSDFDSVKLYGKGDIFLTQGQEYSILIEANEEVLNRLIVRVEGDALIIDDRRLTLFNIDPIKIYITMPEVEKISISGSGDILGQNKITSEDLEISIAGSGDTDLNLNVEELTTRISGSGDVNYVGSAREHSFSVSGSGDLHSFDLETETSNIRVSGSGDVEVFATEELDIRISGSGDVFYKGNPRISQSVSS
jgi:hypothetical protein